MKNRMKGVDERNASRSAITTRTSPLVKNSSLCEPPQEVYDEHKFGNLTEKRTVSVEKKLYLEMILYVSKNEKGEILFLRQNIPKNINN